MVFHFVSLYLAQIMATFPGRGPLFLPMACVPCGQISDQAHVSTKMSSKLIAAADYQSKKYVPCDDDQKKCPCCKFAESFNDSLMFANAILLYPWKTINDLQKIPFQSKQGWKNIQSQCKDLCKVEFYLKTNTRPGVRDTRIKDVKRYLQQDLVDNEGLLVTRKQYELEQRPRNLIVIPRAFSKSFI